MKIGIIRTTEDMCYNSVKVFNDEIKVAFENIGHEVVNCYDGYEIKDDIDFTIGIGTRYFAIDNKLYNDIIRKPHFAWIIDHPIGCKLSYIKSNYLYHIAIDMEHQMYLEMLGNKVFFLPLGTRKCNTLNENKIYDVVFTGSIEDCNARYNLWKEQSKEIFDCLKGMVEQSLANVAIPPLPYVLKYVGDSSNDTRKFIYDEVNSFVKSYKRKIVLNSIKDHKIHLFGGTDDKELLNNKNIIFEGSVDFEKTYDIFLKSKVAINVSPNYMLGSHDRPITAAEHGAVVLTDENPYMLEHFKNSMLFYSFSDLSSLDDKIDSVLNDENKASEMVNKSRRIIEKEFTWEEKCKKIIEFAQYALNYTRWFL